MEDLISQYWAAATRFAEAHPLATWFVVTSALNALVRLWPTLKDTLPGRVFAAICQNLGVDPVGVLKLAAAGAGTKALGLAAGSMGTSAEALKSAPPPSTPPALLDAADPSPAPPTPRPDTGGIGGSGRRS